jgi:hypothetical protein
MLVCNTMIYNMISGKNKKTTTCWASGRGKNSREGLIFGRGDKCKLDSSDRLIKNILRNNKVLYFLYKIDNRIVNFLKKSLVSK